MQGSVAVAEIKRLANWIDDEEGHDEAEYGTRSDKY